MSRLLNCWHANCDNCWTVKRLLLVCRNDSSVQMNAISSGKLLSRSYWLTCTKVRHRVCAQRVVSIRKQTAQVPARPPCAYACRSNRHFLRTAHGRVAFVKWLNMRELLAVTQSGVGWLYRTLMLPLQRVSYLLLFSERAMRLFAVTLDEVVVSEQAFCGCKRAD